MKTVMFKLGGNNMSAHDWLYADWTESRGCWKRGA